MPPLSINNVQMTMVIGRMGNAMQALCTLSLCEDALPAVGDKANIFMSAHISLQKLCVLVIYNTRVLKYIYAF